LVAIIDDTTTDKSSLPLPLSHQVNVPLIFLLLSRAPSNIMIRPTLPQQFLYSFRINFSVQKIIDILIPSLGAMESV
jgi:hypothetical protein